MRKLLFSTLLAATVVVGGSIVVANTTPTTPPRTVEHSHEQPVRQIGKQHTPSYNEGVRNNR